MRKAREKRAARIFAAAICALALCVTAIPAYAAPDTEELEQLTSSQEEKVDSLQSELDSLSSRLEKTTAKVEALTGEVEEATLDLAAARLNEKEQYKSMKERIKFMYENGNVSLFEILLDSKNMADFLNNAEYVSTISDYDRDMLEEFKKVREAVEKKQKKLEAKQKELTSLGEELAAQKKKLDKKLKKASKILADYEEDLAVLKEAEAAVRAARQSGTQVSGNGGGSYFEEAYSADAETIALMAGILECEAGISYEGMIAAGTVIMNRVESSEYPNTIEEVVYQSGQFEPVSTGKLSRVLGRGPSKEAYQAAKAVLGGERHSKVRTCLYFNASYTGKPGIVVGDNVFW